MLLVWKRCFVVSGFCVANASSLQRSLMVVRCAKAKSKWFKRYSFCIASPKTLNIKALGTALGYRHVESHFAYVHRTLTREIAVFEKVHD